MPGRLSTESTGTTTGADRRTVCQRSIGPGTHEIPLGGHPDPEGQEASNSDRGLHGFFELGDTHTPHTYTDHISCVSIGRLYNILRMVLLSWCLCIMGGTCRIVLLSWGLYIVRGTGLEQWSGVA